MRTVGVSQERLELGGVRVLLGSVTAEHRAESCNLSPIYHGSYFSNIKCNPQNIPDNTKLRVIYMLQVNCCNVYHVKCFLGVFREMVPALPRLPQPLLLLLPRSGFTRNRHQLVA